MTEEQERKKEFVKHELSTLLMAIDGDCLGAKYWAYENGREVVTLIYGRDGNNYKVHINVTADSLAALARDVLRGLS